MLGLKLVVTEAARLILAQQYHCHELETLCAVLNIEFVAAQEGSDAFYLDFFKDDFVLAQNFDSGPKLKLGLQEEYLKLSTQNKTGPLKKALGPRFKSGQTLVDASCGTGKDALLLMFYGARVLAFERHPLLFFLLKISFERFFKNYPQHINCFELHFGNFTQFKKEILEQEVKVLYFDPMFDHGPRKKSALPRQEMVLFKRVAGTDADQDEIFHQLMDWPMERIILKRPLKSKDWPAPALATFAGKSVRYDLFRGKL